MGGRVGGAHLVSGVKHFRKVLEVVLEDGGRVIARNDCRERRGHRGAMLASCTSTETHTLAVTELCST